jgi:hypothetical protein
MLDDEFRIPQCRLYCFILSSIFTKLHNQTGNADSPADCDILAQLIGNSFVIIIVASEYKALNNIIGEDYRGKEARR